MDPRYRNPHLKPLGTGTLPSLRVTSLGVVEVNKLVRSLPSVLSYSISELDSSLGVLQSNYTLEITL